MSFKYIFLIVLGIFAALLLAAQHANGEERYPGLLGNGDTYVYFGAVSRHTMSGGQKYNDNHQLVAVQYKNLLLGNMKNSFYDPTQFVNYVASLQIEKVELSGGIGASYGYKECFKDYPFDSEKDERFCPDAMIALTYNQYALQPSLVYKPKVFAFTVRLSF